MKRTVILMLAVMFFVCPFVFGQEDNDAEMFKWSSYAELDRSIEGAFVRISGGALIVVGGMSGLKIGQSHILLFGSRRASKVIVYHTITNRWITKDWGPQTASLKTLLWGDKIVSIGDSGTKEMKSF